MNTNKIAMLTFSATLLASLPAFAMDAADAAKALERADRNNDGVVTKTEVIAMRKETFGKLDRNRDGYVSAADKPGRPMMARRFNQAFEQVKSQFDADKDGRVSRAEMVDRPMTAFDKGDLNKDGRLDQSELAQLRKLAKDKRG